MPYLEPLVDSASTTNWLLSNPVLALFGLLAVFAAASLGAIIGFITKKIAILLAVLCLFVLLLLFHWHLPLPEEVHLGLANARAKLGF